MDPERFSPVDGSSPPLFSLLQKEIDHRFLPFWYSVASVSCALLVRRDRCWAVNFSASVGSYFTNASSACLSVSVWIPRELVHRISGESNVWSGLQRMWWPDQDFVNPASPVLLSELPSGWSAVPRTVLRLLTPMISSLGAGSDTKLKLRSPEASKLLWRCKMPSFSHILWTKTKPFFVLESFFTFFCGSL